MKVKRFLSGMLSSMIVIGSIAAMPVSAIQTAESVCLFYEDFEGENQVVGNAPSNFYAYNQDKAIDSTTSTKMTTAEGKVAEETSGGNKYLSFGGADTAISDTSPIWARFAFDGKGKDDGYLVLEYRAFINATTKNDANMEVQAFVNDGNNEIRNNPIIQGSDPNSAANTKTQFVSTTSNVEATETKETEATYTKEAITIKGTETKIERKENGWNNYKVVVELATGKITYWIDGKISGEYSTGKTDRVVREACVIDSFAFTNRVKGVSNVNIKEKKIDDIKVYLQDTATTSPFSTITSTMATKDVVVDLKAAVSANTDVKVYDVSGTEVAGSVTLSNENETAAFTPTGTMTAGDTYYVKVAGLEDTYPQTEKTFTYNYAEQYLFYEDFEDATDLSKFYSYDNSHAVAQITGGSSYAAIENTEVDGNTGKYMRVGGKGEETDGNLTNVVFQIPAKNKNDGVIVLEYDAYVDGSSNIYDAYTTADVVVNSGDTKRKTTMINTMGKAKDSEQKNEIVYMPSVKDESNGILNDQNIVDAEGNNLERRQKKWDSYKVEIDLSDGRITYWVNGHISKSDYYGGEMLNRVSFGNNKVYWSVYGFGFGSRVWKGYNSGSPTSTEDSNKCVGLLVDNIKVYLANADTSPFESVVSEKSGKVVINLKEAVTDAGKVKVYDVNGVAKSGEVTLSNDNKTATFTPASDYTLQGGETYYVKADGLSYAQSTEVFECHAGVLSVDVTLDAPNFAENGVNTPVITFTNTEEATGTLRFIIAAFKNVDGNSIMVGADTAEYTLEATDTAGKTLAEADFTNSVALSLTLSEAADTIKVFVWNGANYAPLRAEAVFTNTAEE